MHIYPWQIEFPQQLTIDALNTTTPNLAHLMADLYIEQCTYTYGRLTPFPSSIDLCKTITLNKFQI